MFFKKKEPDELYSEWTGFDILVQPKKWGGSGSGARALAWLFGVAAILSYCWTETQWQSSGRGSEAIGIGASGYALVLYGRTIALAAIGTLFAVLSAGVTMIDNLRLFHRSIHSAAESPSTDQERR